MKDTKKRMKMKILIIFFAQYLLSTQYFLSRTRNHRSRLINKKSSDKLNLRRFLD
jgi:hypothetical protein